MGLILRTRAFKLSLISSLLLIISIAYGQKLWSELWVIFGIIELGIILFFVAGLVNSLTFWIKQRSVFSFAYVPFVVSLLLGTLVILLPLNYMRNRVEFALLKARFNKASDMAIKGPVAPYFPLYKLPVQYEGLSVGGGEAIVLNKPMNKAVFFYTFRGTPDGRQGFVHVRKGNKDICIKEIFYTVYDVKELGNSWYYVSGE